MNPVTYLFRLVKRILALPINHVVNKIDSRTRQSLDMHFKQVEALMSIYRALPNLKFLPPTRSWAGSPDFLAKIMELILKEKPRFILELSSGVSTVVIGHALKQNRYGASLSLEHDSHYAEITAKNLLLNEIEQISLIKYCPIIEYKDPEKNWKWYDIHELKFTNKIDMLVVDGPPKATQELARYPAIPMLHEHFADRFTVVLDDSNRIDESIIIQKWIAYLETHKYQVKLENLRNFEEGMVILHVSKMG